MGRQWTGPEVAAHMLTIAQLSQAEACKIAAGVHLDDRARASAFASEIGGWDIVAVRFPELLAGAKHDENMTPAFAATLLSVAAMCRAQGHAIRF
jgi:hypothetical protein